MQESVTRKAHIESYEGIMATGSGLCRGLSIVEMRRLLRSYREAADVGAYAQQLE